MGAVPFESHLHVVIVDDCVICFSEHFLGLERVQLVDSGGEQAGGEDAVPSGDGMRSHHGVIGRHDFSHVLGAPSGTFVECLVGLEFGGISHVRLAEALGRQAFEEFSVSGREAVVHLVARGPQRVTAGGWDGDAAERAEVGGGLLELNVGMPFGVGDVECDLAFLLVEYHLQLCGVDVADLFVLLF